MSTDPTVGARGGVGSSSEVPARTLTPNDGTQAVPAAPYRHLPVAGPPSENRRSPDREGPAYSRGSRTVGRRAFGALIGPAVAAPDRAIGRVKRKSGQWVKPCAGSVVRGGSGAVC